MDQSSFNEEWQKIVDINREGALKAEDLKIVYDQLRPAVKEIQDLMAKGLFPENSKDIEKFKQDIQTLGLDVGNSARQMKKALDDSLKDHDGSTSSFKLVINDLIGRLNQLGRTGDLEVNKIRIRMKETRDEAERIIDTLPDLERQLRQMTSSQQRTYDIQNLTRYIAAIGSVASGFRTLLNLKKIWDNEDLSILEKTLQIITSVSFAVPMLINNLSVLFTGASKAAAGLKILLVNLLNIQAEELGVAAAADIMWSQILLPIAPVIIAIAALSAAVYGLVKAYNADAETAKKI